MEYKSFNNLDTKERYFKPKNYDSFIIKNINS